MKDFATGFVAACVVAGWIACVCAAPWRTLAPSLRQHLYLGSIAMLITAWSISPRTAAPFDLHFSGACALVLIFGTRLALAALSIVFFATTALFHPYGLSLAGALATVLLPVMTCTMGARVVNRMSGNVFAFVLGSAFFGTALTTAVGLLVLSDGISGTQLALIALRSLVEAGPTCALMTAMTIMAPGQVALLSNAARAQLEANDPSGRWWR